MTGALAPLRTACGPRRRSLCRIRSGRARRPVRPRTAPRLAGTCIVRQRRRAAVPAFLPASFGGGPAIRTIAKVTSIPAMGRILAAAADRSAIAIVPAMIVRAAIATTRAQGIAMGAAIRVTRAMGTATTVTIPVTGATITATRATPTSTPAPVPARCTPPGWSPPLTR
jgi:hypothetical protein